MLIGFHLWLISSRDFVVTLSLWVRPRDKNCILAGLHCRRETPILSSEASGPKKLPMRPSKSQALTKQEQFWHSLFGIHCGHRRRARVGSIHNRRWRGRRGGWRRWGRRVLDPNRHLRRRGAPRTERATEGFVSGRLFCPLSLCHLDFPSNLSNLFSFSFFCDDGKGEDEQKVLSYHKKLCKEISNYV